MFYSYDVATQAMSAHYVEFTGGRGEYRSIPFRYVWPAELDLMAQLAGMRLRDRWEVDPETVHQPQPGARLGLGEARLTAGLTASPVTARHHRSSPDALRLSKSNWSTAGTRGRSS